MGKVGHIVYVKDAEGKTWDVRVERAGERVVFAVQLPEHTGTKRAPLGWAITNADAIRVAQALVETVQAGVSETDEPMADYLDEALEGLTNATDRLDGMDDVETLDRSGP